MKDKYQKLLSEIAAQAQLTKRDPSEITVIAVTKYASIEEMQYAYSLGIRHFGEQRLQIAIEKMSHFPSDVTWHFIGPLQSNKIGKIVQYFSYIHSVDSLRIAEAIARKSEELGKICNIFFQVNTSKEETKKGFCVDSFIHDYPVLSNLNGVNICGLMTMAPLTENQEQIINCFSELQMWQKKFKLPFLSMGMSQDFSLAIAQGATHLRIGSYLFN